MKTRSIWDFIKECTIKLRTSILVKDKIILNSKKILHHTKDSSFYGNFCSGYQMKLYKILVGFKRESLQFYKCINLLFIFIISKISIYKFPSLSLVILPNRYFQHSDSDAFFPFGFNP
jgi:hypothetical protein